MNTFYQMWGKTPAEAQAKFPEQREAAGIKGAPKFRRTSDSFDRNGYL